VGEAEMKSPPIGGLFALVDGYLQGKTSLIKLALVRFRIIQSSHRRRDQAACFSVG
jgi:hypothetical protein